MKKTVFLFFVIFSISVLTTACNQYISVKVDNENIYYGVFNRRDMIHADVKLYKKNSPVTCDGMIFLNSPSRAITLKNDRVDAKMVLSCSDKKLINGDLKMTKGHFDKPYGLGLDQFDNRYVVTSVSKKDFKNNVNISEIKLIDDKNSYLLKY